MECGEKLEVEMSMHVENHYPQEAKFCNECGQ